MTRVRPAWLEPLPTDHIFDDLVRPVESWLERPRIPDTRLTAFENARAENNVPLAIWLDQCHRGLTNWGGYLITLTDGRRSPAECHAILVGAQLYGWITLCRPEPMYRAVVPHNHRVTDFCCWSFVPGEHGNGLPPDALEWVERLRPLFVLHLWDRMPPRRAACHVKL